MKVISFVFQIHGVDIHHTPMRVVSRAERVREHKLLLSWFGMPEAVISVSKLTWLVRLNGKVGEWKEKEKVHVRCSVIYDQIATPTEVRSTIMVHTVNQQRVDVFLLPDKVIPGQVALQTPDAPSP